MGVEIDSYFAPRSKLKLGVPFTKQGQEGQYWEDKRTQEAPQEVLLSGRCPTYHLKIQGMSLLPQLIIHKSLKQQELKQNVDE